MLRLLPLLLLLLVPLVGTAQPSGLYLTGSWNRVSYDANDMNMFNETYSEFFVQRLDGPVQLLPTGAGALGLGFQYRVDFGSVGMSIGYTWARGSDENTALFENDSGRRIHTRIQDHIVVAELTTSTLAPIVLGGVFTGNFRGIKIRSTAIHPDGSESWGSEYILNGVYTNSAPHLEFGLLAGYQVNDRIFIPFRLMLPFDLVGLDKPTRDYDVFALNNYFPMDYHVYRQDATGMRDDEAGLLDKAFISGLRLQFGIEIRLF